MNLTLFKFVITFLKYFSFLGSLIFTLHAACLLSGINLWFLDMIVGISITGYVCLMVTSFLLKLCNLYRCFLTHLFFVSCCISIQKGIGLGLLLFHVRLFALITGIILIILFIYNEYKNFNCELS